MRLQELLNLLPAQSFLVHFPIAHCITRMDDVDERCVDGGEHEFDKRGGLACIIAGIDSSVVFLLMVVDDGFDRQPCKHGIPFGEQQRVPKASNTAIAVCKGMDQFPVHNETRSFGSTYASRWTLPNPTVPRLNQVHTAATCQNAGRAPPDLQRQRVLFGICRILLQVRGS